MWPPFPSGIWLAKLFIQVVTFYLVTCRVMQSQFVHIVVT